MGKKSVLHAGNTYLIRIGKTIKLLRKEMGLSQEELALNSGLDRSYLGAIERGENNPTIINIIKIAGALKINASELLKQSHI